MTDEEDSMTGGGEDDGDFDGDILQARLTRGKLTLSPNANDEDLLAIETYQSRGIPQTRCVNISEEYDGSFTEYFHDRIETFENKGKGGVRGRQEIEEKLEELEERHGTTVGDDEYGVVIQNEEERRALEWVLGEVEDL